MKNIQIGIIGGTGGIGRWFARFFKKEGYAVHVSGRKPAWTWMKWPKNARLSSSACRSAPLFKLLNNWDPE